MHLGAYLMHAWLGLITKLPKYTLFGYSWSTRKESKNWDAVFILNWGWAIHRVELYQIVKTGRYQWDLVAQYIVYLFIYLFIYLFTCLFIYIFILFLLYEGLYKFIVLVQEQV